ncbi:hypothetical protein, partial [Longimicrobium sp.]|uniref:hypothetical protein n=1 Tax=Longimicrobium sp. TaxID=2029185 RepID=UPI002E2EC158
LVGAPLSAQTTTPPPARPSDVRSPQAIVEALYDVISGPAARPRDWDRFRSLFLGGAQLAFLQTDPSTGQPRLFNLSVETFIRAAGPGYQTGDGFWEREIGFHLDRFGSIAQVFSTYETRLTGPKGDIVERGINGVQLIYHQDRWWITNMVFDVESDANPIPARFLGTTGG